MVWNLKKLSSTNNDFWQPSSFSLPITLFILSCDHAYFSVAPFCNITPTFVIFSFKLYMYIIWNLFTACTAERFFRIDKAQEHLHYLTDIAQDALFVLDAAIQTPDDEGVYPPSPSGEQTTPELRWVVIGWRVYSFIFENPPLKFCCNKR